IAASVFVLAVELARDPAHASAIRRRPWTMAFAFGLLHGLGFAGALAEAGLPRDEIPLALLGFNLGIETGRVALLACRRAAGAGRGDGGCPPTPWDRWPRSGGSSARRRSSGRLTRDSVSGQDGEREWRGMNSAGVVPRPAKPARQNFRRARLPLGRRSPDPP